MDALDPNDPEVWRLVRTVFARMRTSSLHCSVASISPDGSPHLTPIGSLALREPGRASYLDVFNVQLARNLDHDPRVAVMAVDSGKLTWMRAMLRGRFDTPPGVRLVATAGPRRAATEDEIARFQRSVRPALRTAGGRTMWGRTEGLRARDLTITGVIPVRIPRMSTHLWPSTRADRLL